MVGDKISSKNALAASNYSMENIGVTCALSIPSVKQQYITESLDYYDKAAKEKIE